MNTARISHNQSRPEILPGPLVTRITYINVVNGRIMIPRQGRSHDPLKTTLKATGRANHAKMRNIREKPARNPAKQPELFCCLIFILLLTHLTQCRSERSEKRTSYFCRRDPSLRSGIMAECIALILAPDELPTRWRSYRPFFWWLGRRVSKLLTWRPASYEYLDYLTAASWRSSCQLRCPRSARRIDPM